MKNVQKIISTFIIVALLIILMSTTVFASRIDVGKLGEISNPTGVASLTEMSGKILNVIYTVAVIASVAMMLVIGIKYITASPDQKASLKSRAIPYLIGAFLVFGTANILRFISTMAGWIKV